ncbi:hypothetical protein [Deinococcus soli (ex Cha et al. 2016)]|uniref:Uncharacterized protein n=2 Tax=Deinococcus soli (ex Cha et al. 2016) TaxID=1309411 RepID=A0ACC6KG21_9DEIO|nr:hypothetical protein [Deinococcus soli (ex Cha et al. 2016)]MDR6218455.1 hypothetical protein [Deinococcus soli (ex Cha et al. 2016)]MDR6329195.1 hypothetical protein [Deinococcus soli (ex Cha et al. 2016)]MDR6751468.1 hypothetical protein [Deinococcus soli (ex Cha et al. 2016)]
MVVNRMLFTVGAMMLILLLLAGAMTAHLNAKVSDTRKAARTVQAADNVLVITFRDGRVTRERTTGLATYCATFHLERLRSGRPADTEVLLGDGRLLNLRDVEQLRAETPIRRKDMFALVLDGKLKTCH